MANERDRPGQGSTTSQMQQRVERETESARQSVQNLGESARNQAEATASDLQTEARKVASEQKEVATSSMMDIASAIRRAADDLEAHQQPQVAGMARSIAAGSTPGWE